MFTITLRELILMNDLKRRGIVGISPNRDVIGKMTYPVRSDAHIMNSSITKRFMRYILPYILLFIIEVTLRVNKMCDRNVCGVGSAVLISYLMMVYSQRHVPRCQYPTESWPCTGRLLLLCLWAMFWSQDRILVLWSFLTHYLIISFGLDDLRYYIE